MVELVVLAVVAVWGAKIQCVSQTVPHASRNSLRYVPEPYVKVEVQAVRVVAAIVAVGLTGARGLFRIEEA